MNQYKTTYREMKPFLMLWSTQSFSALGSAMTSYALVIWSYTQERSALMTALLMVFLRTVCDFQYFCGSTQ